MRTPARVSGKDIILDLIDSIYTRTIMSGWKAFSRPSRQRRVAPFRKRSIARIAG
jgi:hypothetical protein